MGKCSGKQREIMELWCLIEIWRLILKNEVGGRGDATLT